MKIQSILNRMLVLQRKKADLKKEEDRLKKMIDKKLGDEDKVDVDGYRFARVTTYKKEYTREILKKYLKDEDAVNSCMAPNNKLVTFQAKAMELNKLDIKLMKEDMIVVSESNSIKLSKINTTV